MSGVFGLAQGRDKVIDTWKSRVVKRVDAPIANIGIITKTEKLEFDGSLELLAVMKTLTMSEMDQIEEQTKGRFMRIDSEGREMVWTEQLYGINEQKFQVILPAGQTMRSTCDIERLYMSRKYQNFLSYVMMGVLVIVNIIQTWQLLTFEPIQITPLWSAVFTFLTTSVLFSFLFLQTPAVTFGTLYAFDITQTDGRGRPVYRCFPTDSLSVPLDLYFSQLNVLRDTIPIATQKRIAQLERENERLNQAFEDASSEIQNLEKQNGELRSRLLNAAIRKDLDETGLEDLEVQRTSLFSGVGKTMQNLPMLQYGIVIIIIFVCFFFLYLFVWGPLAMGGEPT